MHDRKILHRDPTFVLKFSILLFKLYLVENRSKILQLPMKKHSMSIRLFTIKNDSHADIRTPHAQLLEEGCYHGEEDSKNKILS